MNKRVMHYFNVSSMAGKNPSPNLSPARREALKS
jgi:hypothetical protein